MAQPHLDRLAVRGLWPSPGHSQDRASMASLLADGLTLGPPTGAAVLVHGDLNLRHVLVDAGIAQQSVIA